MKKRPFSLILLLATALLLALTSCGKKSATPDLPLPDLNALTLQNLAPRTTDPIETAQYSGQIQLLLFLQPDDPGCIATLPHWNQLHATHSPDGFTLIGLVADTRPPAEITAEIAALDIQFPIGLADAPTIAAFGGIPAIRAIPTAFLLDRNGEIARTYPGFEPIPHLNADITALLQNLPLPNRNPDPDDETDETTPEPGETPENTEKDP